MMRSSTKREHRRRPRLAAAMLTPVLLAIAIPAGAQIQNSSQRKCITAMNKAAAKVAKAQGRQITSCIRDVLNGLTPLSSIDQCVADLSGKIAKTLAKTVKIEAKKCGEVPGFGYSGADTVNSVTVAQQLAHALDLFGDDLEASLVLPTEDRDASRCQGDVAKRYARVGLARLRLFLDCKRLGLGLGTITTAEELEACFDAVDADPKEKVLKTRAKLGSSFIKRCETLPEPTAPFGGVCSGSEAFLECADQIARCRTCLHLNGVDNLDRDCERFDNDEFDGSCVNPSANECLGENGGHNCDANALCIDEVDGFSCQCLPGYEGDGVVCTDVDECAEGTDNCDANAFCTNMDGGFTCTCQAGFTGDGFFCDDVNECLTGIDNCDINATCTNLSGGFSCTCNPGWHGNGVSCDDDDECAGEGSGNNCDANATCTNTPGSFICSCDSGFFGDGVTCTDYDECAGENGGNNCHPNADCINLPGSFDCECSPGFEGDGVVSCVDIDECAEGTDNCDLNAFCTNTVGSFDCTCNAGWHGDGVICLDDNECIGEGSGNNCSINADCLNQPGSFTCECTKGHFGNPFGSICDPYELALTSPTHGVFTEASAVSVSGTVTADDFTDLTLTVNGNIVPILPGGTFSTTIPLDPGPIFNEVRAVLTHDPSGFKLRDRRVVIVGPSVPFGGLVPESVGLRINDSGFDSLEPILEGLVSFDLDELLPPGTVLIEDQCFVDSILGCLVSGDVVILGASLGGFGIDVDSMTNFVAGDIQLDDILVDLELRLNLGDCQLEVTAAQANIFGDYALEPDPSDATVIDVNQLGDVSVAFSAFDHDFTGGFCSFPGIEQVIDAVIGDVQSQVEDGLVDFLADPDGGGPQDAPVAQAIEDALAAIELTGPIGEGFGVDLTTPLFAIPENNVGITLASGAIMSTLAPAPGAPTFSETLFLPATFPFTELGSATTPGGVSFDLGLAISDSAFNQILAALVESGLLAAELSEIDLGGGPVQITAGLLSIFIPEFGDLDPATELTLKIQPTLAPVLTGTTGPGGEIAELVISHLLLDIVSGPPGMETLHGRIAADVAAAFDLTVDPGTGDLLPVLSPPDPNDIAITLLDNPLCMDEATLQSVIPALLAPLFPSLSGLFGGFPLPEFLGLQPEAVEVSRVGEFLGVFLNINVSP